MTPKHVLAATLRGQAQTQRRLSDKAVRKGAYHDDNDHIDAARLMEEAAERIAALEAGLDRIAFCGAGEDYRVLREIARTTLNATPNR